METFFSFFKQIVLLYHYFFMIMENKSNENLMENHFNSIKNENDNSINILSNRFRLGYTDLDLDLF